MQTTETGLRHCVAAFTSALDAFAAAAVQPDATQLISCRQRTRRPTAE
ncbi:MAG: hypothetical protein JO063_06670 [Pseudonocardiales bacterium]|nr:hypothetical protein [Pseudonocardiales bacterium]MBV9030629.1 hypothetical protein [Pseudonocardiales bacterium]MBW0009786.1 hypothetical protein [Pseudonocardiales bacterium]